MKLKYNERTIKQHVLVTPEIAREILDTHNTRNRPISRVYVEQFKEAIRDNEFKEVNAITIDKNGNLLDGQHRLQAVVETNTPVCMTIIFGQDPEDFDLTNTGHAMTIAEFAKTNSEELTGVKTIMYSAASVVKHLIDDKSPRGQQIPKRKLKQFIMDNIDTFRFMSSQKRGKPTYMYNKSILNAIEFLLYTTETEENRKKVTRFFNNLWNMKTDSEINPVEKAYATWISNQSVHTGVQGEISTLIGTYCAWKAVKAGKRIQKLRTTDCTLSDFITEVVEKA